MIENKEDPGRGRGGRHHGSPSTLESSCYSTFGLSQIAVHVDDSDAGVVRLDLAIHLARAFDAELIGIGSLPPESAASILPPENRHSPGLLSDLPFGSHDDYVPTGSDTPSVGSPPMWQARAHAMERWYEARLARGKPVLRQWRVIGHAGLNEMLSFAKTSDLMILGQQAGGLLLPESPGFRPEEVALAAGRPTLIVPATERAVAVGQTIMIAWDGSREAVRAVHDSMPLLRDAIRIVIVEIDRVAQDAGPEIPSADAAQAILERHGLQAFVETRTSSGSATAAVLLETARESNADLIVAGLFHHSQLREGLFGGVSHELLRDTTIPLLVSH